jgi:hypothetical protein
MWNGSHWLRCLAVRTYDWMMMKSLCTVISSTVSQRRESVPLRARPSILFFNSVLYKPVCLRCVLCDLLLEASTTTMRSPQAAELNLQRTLNTDRGKTFWCVSSYSGRWLGNYTSTLTKEFSLSMLLFYSVPPGKFVGNKLFYMSKTSLNVRDA